MIRGVLFFVLIFSLVYIGISQYRNSTGRDRLKFWSHVAYASIPAWIATVISVALIYFF